MSNVGTVSKTVFWKIFTFFAEKLKICVEKISLLSLTSETQLLPCA